MAEVDRRLGEMATDEQNISESVELKNEFVFKVLVVGDLNTGKTCLIHRYVHNNFRKTRSTVSEQLKLILSHISIRAP